MKARRSPSRGGRRRGDATTEDGTGHRAETWGSHEDRGNDHPRATGGERTTAGEAKADLAALKAG